MPWIASEKIEINIIKEAITRVPKLAEGVIIYIPLLLLCYAEEYKCNFLYTL